MPIIGVIREASRSKNQITLERAGDSNFDTKLVRCPGFTFGDHLNLGCMPSVELGYTFGLTVLGMRHQLFAFLGEVLLQINPNGFCYVHKFAARHFKKTAIRGVGNRLGLNG